MNQIKFAYVITVGFMTLLVLGGMACGQHEKQRKALEEQAAQAEAESQASQRAEAQPQPQPESAPPIERPPDVIGYPRPQDGVAFTGVFVLNECGTIGSPTDCLAKELPQHSYTGPASVYQVSLKIEGGAYETWACVLEADLRDNIDDFIKWHIGADFNEAWSCGGDEGNDGPAIIELTAGQKYRFARRGNSITFRPFKSFDKVSYGAGSPTVACYFMLLGACDSIHDCQDVPRRMVFGDGWRQAAAPDEYRKYDEYMKIKEQRENNLNTPR